MGARSGSWCKNRMFLKLENEAFGRITLAAALV